MLHDSLLREWVGRHFAGSGDLPYLLQCAGNPSGETLAGRDEALAGRDEAFAGRDEALADRGEALAGSGELFAGAPLVAALNGARRTLPRASGGVRPEARGFLGSRPAGGL